MQRFHIELVGMETTDSPILLRVWKLALYVQSHFECVTIRRNYSILFKLFEFKRIYT